MADVVEQTEELSAIVSDLIELARGDQPEQHVEDLDLAGIVRDALERARRHAPGRTFADAIEPWPLTGTPERLGRAVNNVLDNAAKFSPPGSEVRVSLRGGVLEVADHGPGVPAADLSHIFDRFVRAGNAGERHGSGLGLAIVRQVVEAHGGTAEAEPAPGGGLLVRLRFPAGD
jgi:two-component system sensor histidine kinase MprB